MNQETIKGKFNQLLKDHPEIEIGSLVEIQDLLSDEIKSRIRKDPFDPFLVEAFQRIEDLRHKNEDIGGVPSGFQNLDRITYGWQAADLIVVASRPSVGKTAFALNLARNAALHPTKPTPVAFFSLEMSSARIVQRILSAESEIWLEKISRGKMEEHEMKQLYARGIQHLAQAPIFIDDTAGLNIEELKTKCKAYREANVGLIIVDYLQLMNGINESVNREQDLSKITRELKALSKELNIPIILLSQLSREVEKRKDGNKMPQLSDLRDSGAIEQDADIVMFLYRRDYYDTFEDEMDDYNRGETYVRIAKHRNGSLETIKLRALLHIQKFIEDSGGNDFGSGLPSNFKPVFNNETGGARMFMQTGNKMNDLPDDEDPF